MPPHGKITTKMLDETDMEEIGHCLDLIQAAKVFVVVCSALGFQKLGKAHGRISMNSTFPTGKALVSRDKRTPNKDPAHAT